MATENVGDMPMVDVCMAQPYHVGMLTSPELVQRDRFSVESIQYNGYCDEFVVMDFCGQKIKLWKPSGAVSVEPCLTSRSGTCQLKEPFWPCRRRFVDSLLLVQVKFLPRMWQGKVANVEVCPRPLTVQNCPPFINHIPKKHNHIGGNSGHFRGSLGSA